MTETKILAASGALALEKLFDNGNYTEIGAHVRRSADSEEYEGVVCGYGPINGRLVFAFAQDAERENGAFDSRSAKKISNLYELALKSGAPVVGVFASAGSVITEGSSLLGGLSSMLTSVAMAKDEIPQVALISGVCTGCMAVAASMFDFTVAVKGSEFSAVPGSLTGGAVADASIVADDEASAYCAVRSLITALPDSCDCGPAIADETDLNRPTGITADEAKDARKLIAALSDDGSFVEVCRNESGITTGFAPVAGRYAGIVFAGGDITAKGAEKAASFVSFCSNYSIPIITLINSDGFAMTCEEEKAGLALASAKLAAAYRESAASRISVAVGNACGAVLPIMGSRSGAADISFALENSVIAPLSPARAVAFGSNHLIDKNNTREALELEYAKNEASPDKAAFAGEIDFIVGIDELRARVCGALFMLDRE